MLPGPAASTTHFCPANHCTQVPCALSPLSLQTITSRTSLILALLLLQIKFQLSVNPCEMTGQCQNCLLIHKSINNAIHQVCHSERQIATCPDPCTTPKPKLECVSFLPRVALSPTCSLTRSFFICWTAWFWLMALSGWDSTCSDNESRMYSLSQAQQMSGAEGLRDARNNIQFLPSPLTGQYAAQGLIYVDKMQAGLQQLENCPQKPWRQCGLQTGPACWLDQPRVSW